MSVAIAGIIFDHHRYDDRGDVLHLCVEPSRVTARTITTPEGHAVDYDESGAVISMALVNVRLGLEQHGSLTLTVPPHYLAAEQIEPALIASAENPRGEGKAFIKLTYEREGET